MAEKPILWQPEERRVDGQLERIWPFRLHLTDAEMKALRRRARAEGRGEAELVQAIFRGALHTRLNFEPQKLACEIADERDAIEDALVRTQPVERHAAYGDLRRIHFGTRSVTRRFMDALLQHPDGVPSRRLKPYLEAAQEGRTVGKVMTQLRQRLRGTGWAIVNTMPTGGNKPSALYRLAPVGESAPHEAAVAAKAVA
ncbi:MAG: hypothetical protein AAF764_00740 [Pseudomonadota bacterium]